MSNAMREMCAVLSFRRRKNWSIALCISLMCLPVVATATSSSAGAQELNSADTSTIQEIVVTARKREEPLVQVPISVSVLSGAELQLTNSHTIQDVAAMTPNITIVEQQSPGVSQIYIRGIGTTRNGEPPVSVVVDGVQISNSYQITQELLDVDQVEVLKGPQGALYGRNAIGGAIVIQTSKPSNDFKGTASAGWASADSGAGGVNDWRYGATLSGPIVSDLLLFKLAVNGRAFDGDIINLGTGHGDNPAREVNFRGGLLFTPISNLEFDLRYANLHIDAGGAWYQQPGLDMLTTPFTGRDSNAVGFPFARVDNTSFRDINDLSLKITASFSGFDLISTTAYSDVSTDLKQDASAFTFIPGLAPNGLDADQPTKTSSWSEELRLTSTGNDPLKWMLGGYYLNTNYRQDLYAWTVNVNGPFGSGIPLGNVGPAHETRASYAGFGQIAYRFADKLEIATAFRYDIDNQDSLELSTSQSFKSFQPKLSASYFLTDRSQLYAYAARGYRSGGFNAAPPPYSTYLPEKVWTYEAGYKLLSEDRHYSLNLAAFYNDLSNVQLFVLKPGPIQIIETPIPTAASYGIEADAQARPVDHLQFNVSVGLLRSRINSYDGAIPGLTAGEVVGNELIYSPRVSYSVAGQYEFQIGERTLRPRIECNGYSSSYWEVDNLYVRKAVNLTNVRLTLKSHNTELTAYGENIFHVHSQEDFGSARFNGLDYAAMAPGWRSGLTLTHRF